MVRPDARSAGPGSLQRLLIWISAQALVFPLNGSMTSHRLRRDIAVILAIKLLIVVTAALLVFGPRQRPQIDIATVDSRMLNLPPADRSPLR